MNNPLNEARTRLKAVKKSLPKKAAALIVDFFKGRFQRQSWVDTTVEKWRPRKDRSKKNRGRAILVKTGRLRRSIRAVSVAAERVVIGSDVPYAQIHNEGGRIEGSQTVSSYTRRAHRRKGYTRNGKRVKASRVKESTVKSHTRNVRTTIPRRQFLGDSAALKKRLEGMIIREINRALDPRR